MQVTEQHEKDVKMLATQIARIAHGFPDPVVLASMALALAAATHTTHVTPDAIVEMFRNFYAQLAQVRG
jgi:hypothetical protein